MVVFEEGSGDKAPDELTCVLQTYIRQTGVISASATVKPARRKSRKPYPTIRDDHRQIELPLGDQPDSPNPPAVVR